MRQNIAYTYLFFFYCKSKKVKVMRLFLLWYFISTDIHINQSAFMLTFLKNVPLIQHEVTTLKTWYFWITLNYLFFWWESWWQKAEKVTPDFSIPSTSWRPPDIHKSTPRYNLSRGLCDNVVSVKWDMPDKALEKLHRDILVSCPNHFSIWRSSRPPGVPGLLGYSPHHRE